MAQCYGCGRPRGLNGELGCPCWLAVTEKGIVPERLRVMTKKARRLREEKGR